LAESDKGSWCGVVGKKEDYIREFCVGRRLLQEEVWILLDGGDIELYDGNKGTLECRGYLSAVLLSFFTVFNFLFSGLVHSAGEYLLFPITSLLHSKTSRRLSVCYVVSCSLAF
jgi:hypothetical protein